MIKTIFYLSLCFYTLNSHAQKILFYKDGHKISSVKLEKLVKMAPHENVSVYLTNIRRNVQYKAIRLRTILNNIFKKEWKETGKLEFYTKTRYRPQVPISFMKYREPYLAFAMTDGKKFLQIDKTQKKLVDLAPLYLIWEKTKKLDHYQKRQFRKIYQIIGINLVTTPLEELTKGQRLYDRFCLRCHAVNERGGSIAPSFEASNITRRWGKKRVIQYIINPLLFNPHSKMPQFNYVGPKHVKKVVEEIVQYIEKISTSNKKKKRHSKIKKLEEVFN